MAEAQQPQLEDYLLQPKRAQEAAPDAEEAHDPLVNHALHRLETFLLLLGFCQSSFLSFFLSWAVFLLLGLLIPALTIFLSRRSAYQVAGFELFILTSQVLLAAVSLICISHGIRKYGTRKFLFVDRFHGQMFRFRKEYVEKIQLTSNIISETLVLLWIRIHLAGVFFSFVMGVLVSGCCAGGSIDFQTLFIALVLLLFLLNLMQNLTLRLMFSVGLFKAKMGFYRVLFWWIFPCFLLKTVREVLRLVFVDHKAWWQSVGIFLALVVSWMYVSLIFLSACSLFNLICNLQGIHFEDYGKLLERDTDTSLEEHMRLRYNLSKISHRFRIFLLLVFLIVTASQFVSLFLTTGYHGVITFISGGDFAVSSIVQVVGIILCLHAATKITRKAQGIAAVASRWHALATCCSTSDAPQLRVSNSAMNLEADPVRVLHVNYSESDLESSDTVGLLASPQLGPHVSSYNKRQALVMYLQSNLGGLTIFGWAVDRALINTLFFVELSLVLFVLGKTIVFTSK